MLWRLNFQFHQGLSDSREKHKKDKRWNHFQFHQGLSVQDVIAMGAPSGGTAFQFHQGLFPHDMFLLIRLFLKSFNSIKDYLVIK